MKAEDSLRDLLTDFFGLPAETSSDELAQNKLPSWDSLAMVQLIGELQKTFQVEFELDEIERLRSYREIRDTLSRKGIVFPR